MLAAESMVVGLPSIDVPGGQGKGLVLLAKLLRTKGCRGWRKA
jgi:hypothetical protein